jgi:hypothetical protein
MRILRASEARDRIPILIGHLNDQAKKGVLLSTTP